MSRFLKISIVVLIFALNFHSIFDSIVYAEEIPENRTVAEQLKEAEKQRDENSANKEEPNLINDFDVEEPSIELQEETSLFWSFLKLIAALAFVIFIMFLLLKLFSGRSRSFRTNKTIENIGGVSLGANRSVQIVRVGDKVLIVGVGENVQLLIEINNREEVERLLDKHERELERLDVPIMKLSTLFKGTTSGSKKDNDKQEVEFGTMLKQQLENVSESQKKVHEAMKEQKR